MSKKTLTMTPEELQALVSGAVEAALKENNKRRYDDDDLQPIFMQESKAGNEYAGGKLVLDEDVLEAAAGTGAVWINIFPNKYRDEKHPKRPAYKVAVRPYTPKEDSDES